MSTFIVYILLIESSISLSFISALSQINPVFRRPPRMSLLPYYYAAFYINVNTTGYYNISSFTRSRLDTVGYIYNNTFDAEVPTENLLLWNDDDAGDGQFLLSLFIETTVKYILVVTSFYSNQTGTFSILTTNAGAIRFTYIL